MSTTNPSPRDEGNATGMRLYHSTTREAAAEIVAFGFRDSPGDRLFPTGVWLSDSPDPDDRAMARQSTQQEQLLSVEIPDQVARRFLAATFERWREFCIPAEIVNQAAIAIAEGGE